jgi:nitroreductase
MDAVTPLPTDTVGLIEGIVSTRSIRRYRDEPVPAEALRAMLFAATRAPSGSNRQPFRMLVLTDGPKALEAKRLIGGAARAAWAAKRADDGYDRGSGADADSPKARTARAMQQFVDGFDRVPVLVLPCLVRYREATSFEGASVYPACQNLLLAARALGYGGVMTGWHAAVEPELRELLAIPDDVFVAGTITLGRPEGHHGPVRRRPMGELVFADSWGAPAEWAVDPPGTTFTSAGPPKR